MRVRPAMLPRTMRLTRMRVRTCPCFKLCMLTPPPPGESTLTQLMKSGQRCTWRAYRGDRLTTVTKVTPAAL